MQQNIDDKKEAAGEKVPTSEITSSGELEHAERMVCGIVMPIAGKPEYPAEHWKDVLSILCEAIEATGIFKPRLVSDDEAIGLIHERIVTNLYANEMVVCDVS